MFRVFYLVWLLLPLTYALMGLWGVVKKVGRVHGKEHTGMYFRISLYCLLALAISVVIDHSISLEALLNISFGIADEENEWVLRLLIYPAVLAVFAVAQGIIRRERREPGWQKKQFLR